MPSIITLLPFPSSYGSISSFLTYLIVKILQPWNSDQVIETGTIQQIDYGFPLVFYRNFAPKTHHFWDIHLQKIT